MDKRHKIELYTRLACLVLLILFGVATVSDKRFDNRIVANEFHKVKFETVIGINARVIDENIVSFEIPYTAAEDHTENKYKNVKLHILSKSLARSLDAMLKSHANDDYTIILSGYENAEFQNRELWDLEKQRYVMIEEFTIKERELKF